MTCDLRDVGTRQRGWRAMSEGCQIVDIGTDVRCLRHDVQAEPAWPDAMNPAWVCPVADDPDWQTVHNQESP